MGGEGRKLGYTFFAVTLSFATPQDGVRCKDATPYCHPFTLFRASSERSEEHALNNVKSLDPLWWRCFTELALKNEGFSMTDHDWYYKVNSRRGSRRGAPSSTETDSPVTYMPIFR